MEVADLALQNPWWAQAGAIEEDEKVRAALTKPVRLLYPFEAGNRIILGPRQVGKTTRLKLAIRDLIERGVEPRAILYFSCEPLRDKADIVAVLSLFDKLTADIRGHKYIFLDEVTAVRDWEWALKHFLETPLSRAKTVYVTGSSALMLRRGAERLPGRPIATELFLPLSFRAIARTFCSPSVTAALRGPGLGVAELTPGRLYAAARPLAAFQRELDAKLYGYFRAGGYPAALYELYLTNRISEQTYEVYTKWILGDINRLGKSEQLFRELVFGLLRNYGTKFSLHSIAKETAIKSHLSVAEYLEIAQALLLLNNLYQVDLGRRRPLFRRERKGYFIDPFLYSVLSGYTKGRYMDYSVGNEAALLEGAVCEALARLGRRALDISHFLWFWSGKRETDFVLAARSALIGLEVKWQEHVDVRDFGNPQAFQHKVLISKATLDWDSKNRTAIIPASLFLALL